MSNRRLNLSIGILLIFLSVNFSAFAQDSPVTSALANLNWRSIGPANMGGRVADVEGVPGDPNIVYVATGAGGIFKTTNGGIDWTPIFDRQNTISVGDIALEPGNPDVICCVLKLDITRANCC
jgi:hypothetical protein